MQWATAVGLEKNVTEKREQTDREQTDRQTDRQTENSKSEATLIPMDRRGEQANKWQGPALGPCS